MLTTREPERACHPVPGRVKPTGHGRRATVAAVGWLMSALLVGCASTPLEPLQVEPLGRHTVEVGEAWIWPLTIRGAELPLQVEVVQGPASLQVMTPTTTPTLGWQPTVLDLAPTPVGVPRAPGAERSVEVRVRDASGRSASASGTVRAVPASVAFEPAVP